MMTPVLRTRCTKAMNLKAHTQRALKRGDGNSNSKASRAAGSGPVRHLIIKDNLDRVVI